VTIFREDIERWFTHHPPKDEATVEAYEKLREAGKELAYVILALVPVGSDQAAAIRKVREAVMTANAGIACEVDS
jgi:hypothetical protein